MSIHYMAKVWELDDLSMGEKFILLKLADNANDKGISWPSLSTIAKHCCCNRSTVVRNLKKLADRGLIIPIVQTGRGNKYDLTPLNAVVELGANCNQSKLESETGESGGLGANCNQSLVANCNQSEGGDQLQIATGLVANCNRVLNPQEPSVLPLTPTGGKLPLRIRLTEMFGHRNPRLEDRRLNRAWEKALQTGGVTEENVELVEQWYAFRNQPESAQPKRFWARSSIVTLLNNWADDVAFIEAQLRGEMEDNRLPWEKGELIELSN